jgi:hypothetical protein
MNNPNISRLTDEWVFAGNEPSVKGRGEGACEAVEYRIEQHAAKLGDRATVAQW